MSTIIHFGFLISCTNAQYQPLPIKTATLTTSQTSENGADITILDSSVATISNNEWNIKIPYFQYNSGVDQYGFDMLLNLDNSWGFHPTKESTLDITIYSDDNTGGSDQDLIISFSVDNSKYISIFFTLDNTYGNAIYPNCGSSLASGNINNIVSVSSADRESKCFGNAELHRLQPQNSNYYNYWPITISLRNRPGANRLYVSVTNPQISVQPNAQTCEYSRSFPTDKGLQMYMAADEYSDRSISLSQFKIDYSYQLTFDPTESPSSFPTRNPTGLCYRNVVNF